MTATPPSPPCWKHGDFGLGTFNALDGEMIVLDGIAYRLTGEGSAGIAPADALTPYAAVIPFDPDTSLSVEAPIDKMAFEAGLDSLAESPNLFYALRLKGRIDRIRFRNVPRQEKPYRPLLDVVKTQAESERHDITGTILGFRCPDYAVGIGVPGYHLHFISQDRSTGGHVLDYRLGAGRLEIDHTSSLHIELPRNSRLRRGQPEYWRLPRRHHAGRELSPQEKVPDEAVLSATEPHPGTVRRLIVGGSGAPKGHGPPRWPSLRQGPLGHKSSFRPSADVSPERGRKQRTARAETNPNCCGKAAPKLGQRATAETAEAEQRQDAGGQERRRRRRGDRRGSRGPLRDNRKPG